jgi:hypothetical protein
MKPAVSNHHLSLEINRYHRLREQLRATYPEIAQDKFADTLEGITDLHEMIAEIIRSALADQAMVSGLKERLEEMRVRLARLDERSRKKRQLALDALVDADIKKLMQPDFTVSVRPGTRALVVLAEGDIPEAFWIPQPPKLDRQGVVAALKTGTVVAGASLNNPAPTLSVRTR